MKLSIEYLSGPFDGATVSLEGETRWGRAVGGALGASWDAELAETQAVLRLRDGSWEIEPVATSPSLYLLREGGDPPKIAEVKVLRDGDIIHAAASWFRVGIVS